MNYENYAEELTQYITKTEKAGRIVQYNIAEIKRGELAVLLYLIDEKDGANAGEISHALDVNTSRVAAILNSLSRKEYIQRISDLNDKRKIQVYITDKGKEFAMTRRDEMIHHISHMLSQLGEKDALEYVRICKRISGLIG